MTLTFHIQSVQEFLAVWRSTANVVVLQYPTPAAWRARRDTACRTLRALLQKICRLQRSGGDWLDQIDVVEIASTCTQLLYTLRTKDAAEVLLDPELAGGLQTLLHIIQMLLDQDIEPSLNSVCLRTLLELSKTYNVYPAELILQDIAFQGNGAVAEGRYGAVWKAVYQAEIVAVKMIKVYQSSNKIRHQRKVSQETLIWRQLCHPNVLPLLGLFFLDEDPSAIGLVSPFMENGDVHQYLARYPYVNRVPLIVDVASGLHYLHSLRPKIIHGDLKGINILITPAHRACIADFGVSAMAADGCGVKPLPCVSVFTGGTLRWFAPELLNGTEWQNTLEADIYAFACVCYEMYSGMIPWYELKRDGQVIIQVAEGHRPARPRNGAGSQLDDSMWALVEDCWHQYPPARPTSAEVLGRLYSRHDVRHRTRTPGNYRLVPRHFRWI